MRQGRRRKQEAFSLTKHCLVSPQPVRARLHEGPTRPRMSLAPINQSLVTMESLPASPWHGSQLMMVCPVDCVGARFNGHRLLAALKSYGRPRRSIRMHTAGRGVHELRCSAPPMVGDLAFLVLAQCILGPPGVAQEFGMVPTFGHAPPLIAASGPSPI